MLDRMLPDTLREQAAVERIVVVGALVEHIEVAVGAALVAAMPVVPLLGSIAGRGLGPCMLSSHLCRLIYHNGCTRILRVSWDGRNIGLEMEL